MDDIDLLPVPKPTIAPVSATAVTTPTAQKAVVTPALDKAKIAAKPPGKSKLRPFFWRCSGYCNQLSSDILTLCQSSSNPHLN
jgi:hypothetical protein